MRRHETDKQHRRPSANEIDHRRGVNYAQRPLNTPMDGSMAIYLKFGNVRGNGTAANYVGQTLILGFEFKTYRRVSMDAGQVSNRESSKAVLGRIVVFKRFDSASSAFFREAVTGSLGHPATLSFVSTEPNGLHEFMSYKLSDCIVSNYKVDAVSGKDPLERIELSYSAIEIGYKDRDAANKVGIPMRVRYDIKKALVG